MLIVSKMYPTNILDYVPLATSPLGVFMLAGMTFGYDLFAFYIGFILMHDKLKMFYIKKVKFNPVVHLLKTFLTYLFPVIIYVVILSCVYPFIDDGPIFPYITYNFLIKNC
jgi:hypothetical protein